VGGDVELTSGDVFLADGSVIHGDLILPNDDGGLHQSPGATVEGNITSNIAPFIGTLLTKGFLLNCILPIGLLILLILGLGTWFGRQSKKKPQLVSVPTPVSAENALTKLQNLKEMLVKD
jgi:hypothetical protein